MSKRSLSTMILRVLLTVLLAAEASDACMAGIDRPTAIKSMPCATRAAMYKNVGVTGIRAKTVQCKRMSPVNKEGGKSNLLGGSTEIDALPDHRKGTNICDPQDTACDFAESFACRWGSDKKTDNPWYRASGFPDSSMWLAATGSRQAADEPYAIVPVAGGQNSDWFVSDPIAYQHDSEGVVVFDYWLTAGAQVKVCAVSADSAQSMIYCTSPLTQNSRPSSPGPMQVTIEGPINRPFKLAFIPQSANGNMGFVAIDNVVYSAQDICPHATTTTPVPTTTADPGLPGKFGGGTSVTPWPDHRQGVPVSNLPDDLACSFNLNDPNPPCRWGGDGSHAKIWEAVSGDPDPGMWRQQTGSTTLPDGNFLAIDLNGPGEADWLMSDPMQCQKDTEAQVSFQYWVTSAATLKVCAVDSNRQIIRGTCSQEFTQTKSPGPVTAIIPGPINMPFKIAFIPTGTSGFAAVDNVNYNANDICTTSPVEITTTEPPTDGGTACTILPCDFNNDFCNFNPQGLGSTEALVQTGGINPEVGCADNGKVKRDSQSGTYFLAQNVSYNDVTVLESPPITVNRPLTLSMRIFSSMYGGQVSVCTGSTGSSFSGCQIVTGTGDFSLANLKWMTKTTVLNPGTTKIYIVGQMVYENNVCSGLAIDNIQMTSGC